MVRRIVREALARQGLDCISPDLRDSHLLVFFAYAKNGTKGDSAELTQNDRILVHQLVAELEYSAANLLSLAQIKNTETGLRLFISRLKHAIAGCLQAIDSNVRGLNSLLEKCQVPLSPMKPLDHQRVKGIHDLLRTASNEAGAILKRLTGQVRLLGADRLRPRIQFESLKVNYLVQGSIRNIEFAAKQRQITLKRDSTLLDEFEIQGDAPALTEVVDNLLDNALKYAFNGSWILIQTYKSAELSQKMPENRWTLNANGIRIVVTNTGPPTKPEDRVQFFDPFFQGSNRPPGGQVNRGTGIGLAVCRQIVEDHAGRIFLVTRTLAVHGQELITFCVDLPLSPANKELNRGPDSMDRG